MLSSLRSFISIDGEETVELDYSSLQPNIMFTKANAKPLYDDVYHVAEYDRELVKDSFMLLANSKDAKTRFTTTLLERMKGDLELEKDAYGDYEGYDDTLIKILHERHEEWKTPAFRDEYTNALKEAWKDIWDMFGTDEWGWRSLHHHDSNCLLYTSPSPRDRG